MQQIAQNIARKTKRFLLYGGRSKNVHRFLKEALSFQRQHPLSLKDKNDRSVYVNLSFDLELGLNGSFWRGEFKEALALARKARVNARAVSSFLERRKHPYNAQICTGILDRGFSRNLFLSEEQKSCVEENPDAFLLGENILAKPRSPNVELGIHAYSHRDFNTISQKDAKWEVGKSVSLFQEQFGESPSFWAFPSNIVRFSDVLSQYGLCYRGDTNMATPSRGSIPIGLYWHPLSVSPAELAAVIGEFKKTGQPAFLHLWQHFTETTPEETREYVKAILDTGGRFITMKILHPLLSLSE